MTHTHTENKPNKATINKSSTLSTNLESWENKLRQQEKAFYSHVTKNGLGLNTYIELNYFNGYAWTNLIIE